MIYSAGTGVPAAAGDTNGTFARFISQEPLLASLTLFGIITAVGRIFDAVTDPWIASLSDRSRNPKGRRIPFMTRAAVPFAVITVLVFFAPVEEISTINIIWVLVFLILFYLFMTMYCTPYNALLSEFARGNPPVFAGKGRGEQLLTSRSV